VPTKKAKGGRVDFQGGGWSPGVGRDEGGYQSTHPSYGGGNVGGEGPQVTTVGSPIIDNELGFITKKKKRRQGAEVTPIQSFKGDSNYLDKLGLQARNKNLYAAGLLSIEDVMAGDIKPEIYAGISGDNFNIEGQKTKDMTGLYGGTSVGPVTVQGSYEDVDGDVNRNISASTQFGNFGIGTNYNFEDNPTLGVNYNTDNFSGGLTYDGEPKAMFSYSKKLEPRPKYIFGKAKGGLAGILEV